MTDVNDFLEHHGIKGQKWGIRNKRTAHVTLTSNTTGKSRKIKYNPKKLNPNGPNVGNSRQVHGTKREVKNFQKQLNKAGKEIRPKAKDLSDEDLRKAINRMNMEKQYTSLTGNKAKKVKSKGSEFVTSIALEVAKTAIKTVATQQVEVALQKAKISKPKKK